MKKQLTESAYYGALAKLIKRLNEEQMQILIKNISIGRFANKEYVIRTVKYLIEDHVVIFDGKESLFFKRSGLMIWERQL